MFYGRSRRRIVFVYIDGYTILYICTPHTASLFDSLSDLIVSLFELRGKYIEFSVSKALLLSYYDI